MGVENENAEQLQQRGLRLSMWLMAPFRFAKEASRSLVPWLMSSVPRGGGGAAAVCYSLSGHICLSFLFSLLFAFSYNFNSLPSPLRHAYPVTPQSCERSLYQAGGWLLGR